MTTWTRWTLMILIAAAAAIGLMGGLLAFSSNTPSFEGKRHVTIPEGTSFETTLDSLDTAGLLASTRSMRWFGRLTGWSSQVKAGHYAFSAGASNWALLDTIRKGLQTPVRLMIPPGTTPERTARTAARNMAFEASAFREALRDSTLAAELGTTPSNLFGYMLPDTYHFYWQTSPRKAIRHVKASFDRYAARELEDKLTEHSLSVRDATILASIVEWETSIADERPRVAGVYLNRLDIGMPLQADPTVQYAIMEHEGSKRRLLFADYEIEHDYNTYQFRGLPPGPLTNPSRSSLRAVAQAESHDYLYFVADGSGGHTFSRTLREHNRAAQRYYELMRQRRADQND